ncbi:hypothetical protein [Opitutus sp. ER46]|uniref:hypothetical protein n=1 Tax=Opitutus sp. ER46 TaxID=2161864 RepID=UPI000D2F733F|nr:hypothetical protein [Opitutus sp. ER46]PTX97921.1 hypothetical protein DB354_06500 [Opitutus sp. ER46]
MKLFAALCLATAALLAPAASAAPAKLSDPHAAVFMLVHGRIPTDTERATLAGKPADLWRTLGNALATAPESARRTVVERAYADVLGRAPSPTDLQRWQGQGKTYFAISSELACELEQPTAEYRAVMERAYRRVLDRAVYPGEIEYWSRRPVVTFALMTGCIDDWARRNQPGLMETAGTASVSVNSAWLTTLRLSPADADQLRATLGLPAAPRSRAAGRNVIAAAGENVVSVGGVHFVAAGRQ